MTLLKRGVNRLVNALLRLGYLGAGTLFFCTHLYANPVLGNVSAGSASVSSNPSTSTTTINQTTQKAIINWQSFNIGKTETTHFQQPAGGVTLNRISPTQGPSAIYGRLTATGQIILVNPAGIYFGPTAYVNVGGIIASTIGISDANFLAGKYIFDQGSSYHGSILNQGQLIAAEYGLIALLGNGVQNDGFIQATLGKVVLASGSAFTMNFQGNDLVSFTVDEKALQGVTNNGTVQADGGTILVKADVAKSVLDNAINMNGILEARSVGEQNGEIIISGEEDGIVALAGTIDASGKNAGEMGGKVEVTGYNLLIDSTGFIDVSGALGGGMVNIGGNAHGIGPLPSANATVMLPGASIVADALKTGNGGQIVLWSDQVTKAYGSLSARGGAISGNGGFIETSSHHYLDVSNISVATSAPHGSTGQWLLDPANLTITSSDANLSTTNGLYNVLFGNYTLFGTSSNSADSTINASTITTQLASTNVMLQTSSTNTFGSAGDIIINSSLSYNSSFNLILSAYHSITSTLNNAIITNSGAGTVTLIADNSGTGSGTVSFTGTTPNITASGGVNIYYNPSTFGTNTALYSGGTTPTQYMYIQSLGSEADSATTNSLGALSNPSNSSLWSLNFALAKDISASATSGWNVVSSVAQGWLPIGNNTTRFTGKFDGLGHTVDQLYINQASTLNSDVGFFGSVSSPTTVTIKNLGVTNANITISYVESGNTFVNGGILIGGTGGGSLNVNSIITNLFTSGTMYIGSSGTPLATTSVSAFGGVIGQAFTPLTNSYSTANLIAYAGSATSSNPNSFGGLVGRTVCTVSNSYSTGSVTATVSGSVGAVAVGGLVGTIAVTSTNGSVFDNYTVSSVTLSGSPTNTTYGGGFFGYENNTTSILTRNYSTGIVSNSVSTGTVNVGGFGGRALSTNASNASNYWDTVTSGNATGIAVTTAQLVPTAGQFGSGSGVDLTSAASFSGWTITSTPSATYAPPSQTWFIFTGATRPLLMSEYRSTISNAHQLQLIGSTLGGTYNLANAINLSSSLANTSEVWGTNTTTPTGAGFAPIGSNTNRFTGTFNGNNYTISNLTISRASIYTGLFGATGSGAAISNISITGTISGGAQSGSLVGLLASGGTVTNAHSSATVTAAANSVGGLIGQLGGNLSDSSFTGSLIISGDFRNTLGGLVGWTSGGNTITNSFNTGSVTGTGTNINYVGGLVGYDSATTTITNSYNTGTINISGDSAEQIGGLIGDHAGSLSNSFNTGMVSVGDNAYFVGGLVAYGEGNVSNSYNTGSVSVGNSPTYVGGLAGYLENGHTFSYSYSTGAVIVGTTPTDVGGFVGRVGAATASNNFWDTDTSGLAMGWGSKSGSAVIDANGIKGGCFTGSCSITTDATNASNPNSNTLNLTTSTTYSSIGWDMSTTWGILSGQSYPYLKAFYSSTPRIISATTSAGSLATATLAVNGSVNSSVLTGANGFAYFIFANGAIVDATDKLLLYVSGTTNGNAVALAPASGGSLSGTSGLTLTPNTVTVGPGSGGTQISMSNDTLYAAKGTGAVSSDAAILYSVSAASNGTLTLNNNVSLVITSPTIYDAGSGIVLSGTGTATLNGSLQLLSNFNLTTAGADITLGGANGNYGLLLNAGAGTVTLNGSFGTTSALSSMNLTGSNIQLGGTFVLNGNSTTINGPITLVADVDTTDSGAITYNGTVDGNYQFHLHSTGNTVNLNGDIGSITPVANIEFTGTSINLNASTFHSDGYQTYHSPISLLADTTLTTDTGAISAESTISGAHTLSINSASTVSFANTIGGTALTSLSVTGTAINLNGGSITTTNDQDYFSPITLGALSTLTSDSGNIHVYSTVDGGFSLTLNANGTATLDGVVGTTPLDSLSVTGTAISLNAGSITTTNNQDYYSPVTLGAITSLISNAGDVNAHSTVDNGGFDLTVDVAGSGSVFSADISGSGGLIKNGVGTLTLSNDSNDYTGQTTINNGTLSIAKLADGGLTSSIGAASGANAEILLGSAGTAATLLYTGTSSPHDTTDRPITVGAAGGTLQTAGGSLLDLTGTMTLNGTVTLDTSASDLDVISNITGSGGLIKNGAQTLALTYTDNDYTGQTIINNGIVTVTHLADGGATSSLGAASGASAEILLGSVATAATLSYIGTNSPDDSSDRPITIDTAGSTIKTAGGSLLILTGAMTINNNALTFDTDTSDLAVLGSIGTGTGTVTKNGTGLLILAGTNAYTGLTSINAGTVDVANDYALGDGTASALVDVATNATLAILGDSLTIANNITFEDYSNLVSNNGSSANTMTGDLTIAGNAAVTVVSGDTLSLTGQIIGLTTIALQKLGAGELDLSGNSSYNGTTLINEGTLGVSNSNAIGFSNVFLGDALSVATFKLLSSSLTFTNDFDIFNLGVISDAAAGTNTLSGSIVLDGATESFDVSNSSSAKLIVTGVITSSVAITLNKNGPGILVLDQNNSYLGTTNINAGTVQLTHNNSLGDNTATASIVNAGAVLSLPSTNSSSLTIPNAISIKGTGISNTGAIVDATIGKNNIFDTTASITLAAAASSIGVTNSSTTLTIKGVIDDGSNTFGFSKVGSGSLILTNANTFGGGSAGLTISAGKVTISNAAALGASTAAAVVNNTTELAIDGNGFSIPNPITISGTGMGSAGAIALINSGVTPNSDTLTGTITLGSTNTSIGVSTATDTLTLTKGIAQSGSGFNFLKVGTGRLVLSLPAINPSTFTGSTTVSAGTLELASNNALGSTLTHTSGVTVNNGATLQLTATTLDPTVSLILSGSGTSSNGALLSSGASSWVGDILLGSDTTIAVNTDTDTLSLIGLIDGNSAGLTLTLETLNTLSGYGTITLGSTSVSSIIGGNTPLLSVIGNTPLIINSGTINTTDAQTYTHDVTLGQDDTFNATGGTSAVSFTNINNAVSHALVVNAGSGGITISGTMGSGVDLGDITLSAPGTTTIDGTVNAASLTTNAGGNTQINTTAITTTGLQLYADSVTLGASPALNAGGTIIFSGNVSGAQTLTVHDLSNGGNVTFTGTVNLQNLVTGAFNYAVSMLNGASGTSTIAGPTTFANTGGVTLGDGGDIFVFTNGVTSNASNTTIAGTINTTNSGITFGDVGTGKTVTIASTTVMNSNGGIINLGTTDSSPAGNALTLSAGSGAINLNGNVGATTALGALTLNSTGTTTVSGTVHASSLATNAGGTTAINGGVITTTGSQVYHDAVTIGQDTTLTTTTSPVTFDSSINGAHSLMVAAGSGLVTFTGAIGLTAGQTLTNLSSTGSGTVIINNSVGDSTHRLTSVSITGTANFTGTGTVYTSGAQQYSSNTTSILLGASATLNSSANDVLISGDVSGGGFDFTISNAGATSSVAGEISNINSLTKLGVGTLTLGANTYTTTTNVNAGTLNVTTNTSLGTSAATATIENGASLKLTGTTLVIPNALTLNSGSTILDNSSNTTNTLTGGILLDATASSSETMNVANANETLVISTTAISGGSGSNTLIKSGSGTLILPDSNTYSGTTQINAGLVNIQNDTSLGTSSAIVAALAELSITGTALSIGNAITLSGTGISGAGALVDNSTNGNNALNGVMTLGGNSTIAVTDSNTTLTLNNTLVDGGNNYNVTKIGAGVLVFANSLNTYGGSTTISVGTLRLGANNAVPSTSDVTVAGSAIFDLADYSDTIGSIAGAGQVTLGSLLATTLTTADNASTTFSGAISGAGKFVKNGSGTLIFSGNNAYTGTTKVSGGILSITSDGGLGSGGSNTSSVTVDSGATLDLNAVTLPTIPLTLNGSGVSANGALTAEGTMTYLGSVLLQTDSTINSSGILTLNGILSGTGALTSIGSGTLILSNSSNAYSGTTNINAGILQLGAANAVPATSDVVVSLGALFDLANNDDTIKSLAGAGNVSLGSATLTTGSTANTTFSGVMSGSGALIKQGSGIFTLSGVNLYTGTTIINAGTLKLGINNALNALTAVVISNTASTFFDLNNHTDTIASLSGGGALGGNVTLGSGTLITGDSSNTTYAGVISGTNGSVTKQGTGSFTLSGSNTFTGAMTLSNGTLLANNATNPFGVGILNLNGGTLQAIISGGTTLGNSSTAVGASDTVVITGTEGIIFSNDAVFGAGSTTNVTNTANTIAFNGSISGSGAITQNGVGGTVSFAGNDNSGYSGTLSLLNGTMQIANDANASPLGTGSLILDGGTLLASTSVTTNPVTNNITIDNSDTGTVSGTNSITFAGTVGFGNSNSLLNVTNTAGTITFNGVISGAGKVTENGSGGTLTLSATNTYTGITTLTAGTLQANNASNPFGVGALNLNGGTLKAIISGGTTLGNSSIAVGATDTVVITGTESITFSNNAAFGASSTTNITNTANTITFNGNVSGSGAITQNGVGGTVSFAGNNNGSYSGTLSLLNGTLQIANDANISPLGTGSLILDGGTLLASTSVTTNPVTNNITIDNDDTGTVGGTNSITFAGTVGLGNSNSILSVTNTAGTITFNGIISGAGKVTENGSGGILTLSATNTYTGATTLTAGTLQANNASNPFGVGTLNLNGGTLKAIVSWGTTLGNSSIAIGASTTPAIAGSESITFTNNASFGTSSTTTISNTANVITFNGDISGAGAITQNGIGGTVSYAGNDDSGYSGTLTLINGTLQIANDANASPLGTGALQLNGGTLLATTSVVTNPLTNNFTVGGTSTIGGTNDVTFTGTGTFSSGLLTVTNTGHTTLAGNLSGSAGLTENATTGTLTIQGADNHLLTGAVTLTSGALSLANDAGASPLGTGTLRLNGGTLSATTSITTNPVTNNITIGNNNTATVTGTNSITFTGTVAFGNSSSLLNVTHTSGTMIFDGLISGAGAITENASGGVLVLDATNTYTGATTLTTGTLEANNASNPFGVGTLNLNGGTLQAIISGGTTLGNSSIAVGATDTVAITGTESITFSNNAAFGASSTTNITNTANTITFNGNVSGSGAITQNGVGGTVSFGGSNNGSYSGTLSLLNGTLQIANDANASPLGTGALILDGGTLLASTSVTTNPVTNNITIDNDDTGTVSGTNSITFTGTVGLGNSNSLLNVTNTAGTITFNGVISGAGKVTENGSGGTLTLSATNTYTGATTLTAGTLQANNASNPFGVGVLNLNGGTLKAIISGGTTLGNSSIAVGATDTVAITGTESIIFSNNASFGASSTTNITNTANTITFNGNVSGSGAITQNGIGGTVSFAGSNNGSYSGTLSLLNGTMQIANDANASPLGTGALILDGGILLASTSVTTNPVTNNITIDNDDTGTVSGTNSITFTGTVGLGNSNSLLNVTNTAGTITFNGIMSGAGKVTENGSSGTLTLSATNTYTGATTLTAGTLQANNASNPFGVGVLNLNGGTLKAIISGGTTLGNSSIAVGAADTVAITGTESITFSNNAAFGASSTTNITNTANTITFNGNVSGSGAITQNGVGGTVSFAGSNNGSYSGTLSLLNGTLQIANDANASPLGTGALILDGGTLLASTSVTTNPVTNNITIDNDDTGTVSGTNSITFAGTVGLGNSNSLLNVTNTAGTITFNGIISGAGKVIENASGGTLTLSATNTYTGATILTAGTLQANNASNPFGVGTLNLNGGTLQAIISGGTTLGNSSIAVGATDTVAITGTESITFSNNAAFGASSTTNITNTANTITFNGNASGSGAITQNGVGGTVSFAGSNNGSYSGILSLLNGTLRIANDANASPLGTGALILDGGTLLASTSVTTNPVTNNITIDNSSTGTVSGTNSITFTGTVGLGNSSSILNVTNTAGTMTFNGIISGAGKVIENGSGGTLTLSATNTYTGATTLTAGTLQANNASNPFGVGVLNLNGGTLKAIISGGTTLGNSSIAVGATDTVAITGTESITFSNSASFGASSTTNITNTANTITFNGNASGSGAITQNGVGGTLSFAGSDNSGYSGTLSLLNGTLQIANDANASPLGTGSLILDGGTLLASTSVTTNPVTNTITIHNGNTGTVSGTNSITFTGTVGLGNSSSSLTLTNTAGTMTFNDIISGAGSFTENGSGGTTVFGAVNTYSGATTINAGTLQVGIDNGLSVNSPITLANTASASLNINNHLVTIPSLTGGGTSGGNVLLGTGTLTTGTTSSTYSGSISGSGNLIKQGAGTFILAGSNAFTNASAITISAGILSLTNNNALGSAGTLSVAGNGAAFDLNTVSISANTVLTLNGTGVANNGALTAEGISSYVGNVALNTSSSINSSGTLTLSGLMSGSGALTSIGTGTLILSNSGNTYGGATNINAGTLQLGAANAVPNTSDVTIASSALFNLNNFNDTIGSLAGNGNVSLGSGTLTTANNTSSSYSGIISGTGGFTKGGNGTLTFASSQSYLGATSVNGGTLLFGVANALSSGSDITVGAAGILNLASFNNTVKSLAGSGSVIFNGSLTTGSTGNTAFSGVLSGSGNLIKQGTGTFTLQNANSYTGLTTVSNGTLTVTNAAALGNTAAGTTINSGGTLNINVTGVNEPITLNGGTLSGTGTASLTGAINLVTATNNIINANNASTFNVVGDVNGAGSLTFQGAGTITLTGNLGNTNRLNSLIVNANTTIDAATIQTINNQQFNNAITLGANTNINTSAGSITFNSTIDGAHDLIVSSAGTTTFGNAIGTTPLNSLAVTAASIVVNGASVTTIGDQAYNGSVTLGNASIFSASTSGTSNITFTAGITGNKNLTLTSGSTGTYNYSLTGTLGVNNLIVAPAAGSTNNSLTVNTGSTQNWIINGTNSGSITGANGVTGTFTFARISNFVGSNGADNVTLSGGTLAGSIDGAGGTNTLTGDSTPTTWNITSTDAGTVTGVGGNFTNFQNLVGGNSNNTFNISNGATISGSINGGSLANTNTIDYSAYSPSLTVYLTTTYVATVKTDSLSTINTYTNVNNLIGDNVNDYIDVSAKTFNVTLTGVNQGYIDDPVFFTGFIVLNVTPPPPPTPVVPSPVAPGAIPGILAVGTPSASTSNSSSSTLTTSGPSYVIVETQQNLSDILTQLSTDYQNTLNKVKINPYCFSLP